MIYSFIVFVLLYPVLTQIYNIFYDVISLIVFSITPLKILLHSSSNNMSNDKINRLLIEQASCMIVIRFLMYLTSALPLFSIMNHVLLLFALIIQTPPVIISHLVTRFIQYPDNIQPQQVLLLTYQPDNTQVIDYDNNNDNNTVKYLTLLIIQFQKTYTLKLFNFIKDFIKSSKIRLLHEINEIIMSDDTDTHTYDSLIDKIKRFFRGSFINFSFLKEYMCYVIYKKWHEYHMQEIISRQTSDEHNNDE